MLLMLDYVSPRAKLGWAIYYIVLVLIFVGHAYIYEQCYIYKKFTIVDLTSFY